mmetsp:Transcript_65012/g.173317  ORF Transcript_65012/g.173317 Transcript_65012/m.173317 type:complete len:364 (-) Transcript_65012:79-1170(-)
MASFLLALPSEALLRCLEDLRATELAPALAPCCSQLRKVLRQPGIWRREVEMRFPDAAALFAPAGAGCWRTVLIAMMRRELDTMRLGYLMRERHFRDLLEKLEACRELLHSEVEEFTRRLEGLRAHRLECQRRAAQLDSWHQAPSGLSSSQRRVEARRLWEDLAELRGTESRMDLVLTEATRRLRAARSGPAASNREAHLQRRLAEAEAERKRCEERLALLPQPAAGAGIARRGGGEASASRSSGSSGPEAASSSSSAAPGAAARGSIAPFLPARAVASATASAARSAAAMAGERAVAAATAVAGEHAGAAAARAAQRAAAEAERRRALKADQWPLATGSSGASASTASSSSEGPPPAKRQRV